jgi:hypothetical protein
MSKEKERNNKAAEMQEAAMYDDFNAINAAINDGNFEFLFLKEMILKWRKPFQCRVDGVECIVGVDDAPIMQMKPVMIKELAATVLAKRARDNDGDITRPQKKRRNNAAVPTGFGEQGQTASYLVQSRDFEEQKKKDATLLKNKKKRKDAVEKALMDYDKFQNQLRLDTIAWRAEQEEEKKNNVNNQLLSSTNESSSARKKKKKLVRPTELWELTDVSTTAQLDILARLFRIETYKFGANKPAKMSWIPRDRLNMQDVDRGYKSLHREFSELNDFLSRGEGTSAGDGINIVESSNNVDEDKTLIIE